jgi:hypothetical protein
VLRRQRWGFAALVVLCSVLRLPRMDGPIDLRFDAGVYYVLGTSLAQGKGYRLLSEPGEIHGTTYPPLLPALAAAHQLALGTSDPDIVGHALRWTFFVLFTAYILAVFWMASAYLAPGYAFIAALIVALHFRTHLHAEYFVAELPFGLVAALFFGIVGRSGTGQLPPGRDSTSRTILSGSLALAGYFFRTVGITLLAAWVGESLLRRRFRQTAIRIAVTLVAIAAWQAYLSWVRRGPEYAAPAYPYQHASYQIYNVTYGESFRLIEPLQPEAGSVTARDLLARVGSNLGDLASTWGESVSIGRGWGEGEIARLNRMLGRQLVPLWASHVASVSLTLLILGGLVLLGARGAWLIPGYVAMTVALFVVGRAPGSLERYLASIAPLSAVALLSLLAWIPDRLAHLIPGKGRGIGSFVAVAVPVVILAQETYTLRKIFRVVYHPSTWVDSRGRERTYSLYAYDRPWRLHTEALAWLRHRAKSGEIIATSTPHWAYLKTGLKSVRPPWEPDPRTAERLLEAVPVDYLIIDNLSASEGAEAHRRYSLPVVRAFPRAWALIYAGPDSGSRIYRRMGTSARVDTSGESDRK